MKKKQQSLIYGILIILTIAVWSLLVSGRTIDGLEGETLRWRYQVRGELASPAPIIYVDLDAETISYMGDRPWDRREFAVLCQALLGPGQARVVGIDIILSKFGAGSLIDLERAREGDLLLGETVEAFPGQIVLAAAYTGIRSPIVDEIVALPLIRNGHSDPEAAPFPEAPSFPIIKETSGRLGLVNVDEALTAGSIPYYVPAFVKTAGPRFSLHLIDGAKRQFEAVLNRPEVVREGDRVQLVDADGWVPVSVPTNHAQTFFTLGLEMFLAAHGLDEEAVAELEAWFSRFAGAVVFVGPVDPQLKDIAPTPFNREPVPKVGLHGNLYRTIESEAYVRRADLSDTLWLVVGLTLLVGVLASRSGRLRLLAPLLVVLYGGLVFLAFVKFHYVLPLLVPVGSAVTAAGLCVLLKLGSEEWQRRRLKALFGAYVSPKLVEEMVESNQNPQLGGVEYEITALFSDVVGFSALSEELSPDEIVRLMNEYLGAMTDAFQGESGTLDKYVGDAIVTMFGAPVWIEDHAALACVAAVKMQERHAELRQEWAASGKWPAPVLKMRTRIGINTGRAVIGNMGSERRFNYTMMGDSVNLAARCESGAKAYGVYIMVTENTLEAALERGLQLNYRRLDRIIVKGRRQSILVYELWDGTVPSEAATACKTAYESALEAYFAGAWETALEGFERSAAFEPAKAYAPTTPSEVLAGRCRGFIERGGPPDWDGVYQMETK